MSGKLKTLQSSHHARFVVALQDAWVQAVLPLASDPEQGVQSKLAELFKRRDKRHRTSGNFARLIAKMFLVQMVLDRVLEWHRHFSFT